MQTYFGLIHQTIIDNLNFKALEERFKKLVMPESSDLEEWKIVNFFGYLTNIYLDFLKDIVLKLTNTNYSNFVFAESKATEHAVKRFQIKMELTLKDGIKKVSEILNNYWYQELFEQIDWGNSLKGGDYGEFFDKVYKLNNDLVKNSIKYILDLLQYPVAY